MRAVSSNNVSNYKVSNNKVRVLHMGALFIGFLIVTEYSMVFLKPSVFKMAFFVMGRINPQQDLQFFLEFCYIYD